MFALPGPSQDTSDCGARVAVGHGQLRRPGRGGMRVIAALDLSQGMDTRGARVAVGYEQLQDMNESFISCRKLYRSDQLIC